MSVFLNQFETIDTVDQYRILLLKIEKYGIRGLPFRWIESYLSNRSYCVSVGNVKCQVNHQLHLTVSCNDVIIPVCTNEKYLGVLVDITMYSKAALPYFSLITI